MVDLRQRPIKGESNTQKERREQEEKVSKQWKGIPYKRRSRGFKNGDGTQCYRNTTLQSLLHIPKILNWFEEAHAACTYTPHNDCVACMFRELANQYWRAPTETGIPKALSNLVNACRNTASWDIKGAQSGQQDVEEYLRCLLNNGIPAHLSGDEKKVFDAIFKIGIKETHSCRSCKRETISRETQPILEVSMGMHTQGRLLVEFLENTLAEELLQGFTCTCTAKDKTFRKTQIEEPPPILIMQLARYTYHRGALAKRTGPVYFKDNLDLSSHISESNLKPVRYSLKAVIHHQHWKIIGKDSQGEELADGDAGHYKVSLMGPNGGWRELEDTTVTDKIAFKNATDPASVAAGKTRSRKSNWTPYVLIYERMPQPVVGITGAQLRTKREADESEEQPDPKRAKTGKADVVDLPAEEDDQPEQPAPKKAETGKADQVNLTAKQDDQPEQPDPKKAKTGNAGQVGLTAEEDDQPEQPAKDKPAGKDTTKKPTKPTAAGQKDHTANKTTEQEGGEEGEAGEEAEGEPQNKKKKAATQKKPKVTKPKRTRVTKTKQTIKLKMTAKQEVIEEEKE